MSINVVVVGYGSAFGMGHRHSEEIKRTEGLQLVGVCETDATRRAVAAATEGVPTYEHIDEVCDDDGVDMVCLIVPHSLHAPLAIQAMEAGKHVLTEKPMCVTTAEADEMIAASKADDVMLTVYNNRRWDQDWVTVKMLIEEGAVGEVFLVECAIGSVRPLGGWRRDEASGGGMLRDWGAHVLDQMCLIAGGPATRVYAHFEHRMWTDIMDVPTHTQLMIEFESGMRAEATFSNNLWVSKPRWLVVGEEGGLLKQGGGDGNVTWYHQVAGQQCTTQVPCIEADRSELYRNVSEHLNEGAELLITPEQTRRYVSIYEAAYVSAQTGEAVTPK
ncbi:MAG: Gfo/Idh/MocA family protein [Armatimonadota bacterium]|jgi:scyllo-inositol 2-dehydrogenase (NADP+)